MSVELLFKRKENLFACAHMYVYLKSRKLKEIWKVKTLIKVTRFVKDDLAWVSGYSRSCLCLVTAIITVSNCSHHQGILTVYQLSELYIMPEEADLHRHTGTRADTFIV